MRTDPSTGLEAGPPPLQQVAGEVWGNDHIDGAIIAQKGLLCKMKLYEIDNAIQAILDGGVDEETGEVLDIDLEALAGLQLAREQKLEGVALGIKNLGAEVAAIKAEEDRLAKRRKVLENRVTSLKSFLAQALDGGKLETARVKVTTRPGSVSTRIYDVLDVARWYNATRSELLEKGTDESLAEFDRISELAQVSYPDPTVSKTGIKKLMKDYEIPGVELVTGAPSLTIQ